MKLITRSELTGKNEAELRALLSHAFDELARSRPGSAERRNALASIETVQMKLAFRACNQKSAGTDLHASPRLNR